MTSIPIGIWRKAFWARIALEQSGFKLERCLCDTGIPHGPNLPETHHLHQADDRGRLYFGNGIYMQLDNMGDPR